MCKTYWTKLTSSIKRRSFPEQLFHESTVRTGLHLFGVLGVQMVFISIWMSQICVFLHSPLRKLQVGWSTLRHKTWMSSDWFSPIWMHISVIFYTDVRFLVKSKKGMLLYKLWLLFYCSFKCWQNFGLPQTEIRATMSSLLQCPFNCCKWIIWPNGANFRFVEKQLAQNWSLYCCLDETVTYMLLICTLVWGMGNIRLMPRKFEKAPHSSHLSTVFFFFLCLTSQAFWTILPQMSIQKLPCTQCLKSMFGLTVFHLNYGLTEPKKQVRTTLYITQLFQDPDLSLWLTLHYPQTPAVLLNSAVHQMLPSPSLLFHCTQLTDAYPEHVKSSHFGLNTAHTSSDALENWCWQTGIRGYLYGGSTVSLREPWVREWKRDRNWGGGVRMRRGGGLL